MQLAPMTTHWVEAFIAKAQELGHPTVVSDVGVILQSEGCLVAGAMLFPTSGPYVLVSALPCEDAAAMGVLEGYVRSYGCMVGKVPVPLANPSTSTVVSRPSEGDATGADQGEGPQRVSQPAKKAVRKKAPAVKKKKVVVGRKGKVDPAAFFHDS